MLPRNQDIVQVILEVLLVTELFGVVQKVLRGRDVEAPADGVCEVDVLHVLPRFWFHTQTWFVKH